MTLAPGKEVAKNGIPELSGIVRNDITEKLHKAAQVMVDDLNAGIQQKQFNVNLRKVNSLEKVEFTGFRYEDSISKSLFGKKRLDGVFVFADYTGVHLNSSDWAYMAGDRSDHYHGTLTLAEFKYEKGDFEVVLIDRNVALSSKIVPVAEETVKKLEKATFDYKMAVSFSDNFGKSEVSDVQLNPREAGIISAEMIRGELIDA